MNTYTWLQYRPDLGTWATLTRRAELLPCGSVAAYKRHRHRGEPIDPACREAASAARRDRRIRASREAS